MGRLLYGSLLCAICFAASAQGAPAVVVAKTPSLACPQTELGDADLQARYATMWERYSTDVAEVTKKVRGEIEKQTKSATGAGNLDLALFWKTLGKEFEQKGELRWDEPSLKKTWGDRFGDASFPFEFGVAVKKASEAYASARKNLEKGYGDLVAEFTKSEKLEEALKVRGEIKELLAEQVGTPEPTPAPKPAPKPEPKPVATTPKNGRYRFNFTSQEGGLLLEVKDGKLWIYGDIVRPSPQSPNGVSLWPNPFLQKWQGQEEFKLEGGKVMTDIPGWSLTWDLDTGEATRYLKNAKKAQVGNVVPGGW